MRNPEYYCAVFGIIRNERGEILFSRRDNTGHLDGYLSLPAGHVEYNEKVTESMARELKEEIGIDANTLDLIHSQQSRNSHDNKTYFNLYFEVIGFSGEIINNEPDKCSELGFMNTSRLKDEKIVPYVQKALEHIEKGSIFSEVIW